MVVEITRKGLFEEVIDAERKAANVLPEPVGAAMRTSAPD
jgi:hypothetical protein